MWTPLETTCHCDMDPLITALGSRLRSQRSVCPSVVSSSQVSPVCHKTSLAGADPHMPSPWPGRDPALVSTALRRPCHSAPEGARAREAACPGAGPAQTQPPLAFLPDVMKGGGGDPCHSSLPLRFSLPGTAPPASSAQQMNPVASQAEGRADLHLLV